MEPRRGPLTAGEKVQFTDRKGKKITDQLVAGGSTQTSKPNSNDTARTTA